MADTFLLEIVTPSRKILSKEVDELTAPGQEGEFGVLAGHTPFLTILKAGELSYKKGSETGVFAVAGGYAEVAAGKTTILVDRAFTGADIDANAARKALAEAEEALKKLAPEDAGYRQALESYGFAEAQIKVKERG